MSPEKALQIFSFGRSGKISNIQTCSTHFVQLKNIFQDCLFGASSIPSQEELAPVFPKFSEIFIIVCFVVTRTPEQLNQTWKSFAFSK